MSEIFTFEKLYRAYLDCRRTKRKTINALKFEYNFERNLFLLQKELETKRYKPGRSICFVIKEPSPREIFAASFKDRIVHHILIKEIETLGEKNFVFDTFSCRKNKGTHLAVERLKLFVRKATENYKKEAFYLQLDISGFFMAIDRNILYSLFEKLALKQNKSYQWRDDILWLAKTIIFHKPTDNYIIKGNPSLFDFIPPRKSLFDSPEGKGLPIGNYSSQFFANLYLNELDQFVKRVLKCKNYVRYVDDFILLDKNKEKLKDLENRINLFLKNNLDLKLNLNKTKLQPINKGIDFLGYFIKLEYTLVRQRIVKRLKTRLIKLNLLFRHCEEARKPTKQSHCVIPASEACPRPRSGAGIQSMWIPNQVGNDKYKEDCFGSVEPRNDATTQAIMAMINSYYGHFRHAFSFNLRKDIFENHLGAELKGKFLPKPKSDYSSLQIK